MGGGLGLTLLFFFSYWIRLFWCDLEDSASCSSWATDTLDDFEYSKLSVYLVGVTESRN